MSFCVRYTSRAQHKCREELFKRWFGIFVRISTNSMEKSLFRTKISPSCVNSSSLWLFIKFLTRICHLVAVQSQMNAAHILPPYATCGKLSLFPSSFPSKTGWIFMYRSFYMCFTKSFVMWSPWQYSWKPCKLRKILFANIFILCCPLNVRDRVSHSYRPFERAALHYFYCKLGTQSTLTDW